MNMQIYNLKDKLEYIEEVAYLERKEWNPNSNRPLDEKVEKIKKSFDNEYFEKLILVDDDKLVGFISIFEYDMDERKDLKPWYATMYVKEEYRGNGYSKILNDAILKLAKEKGIKRLYLKTTLDNYYEKFGAKLLETIKDEKIMFFDL